MQILVVDDSEDARDIMAATLSAGGYEDVIYAESGSDALSKLIIGSTKPAEPVDVILLDVLMPGMDGIEVCANIRADARYRDVPILMVTSISDINSLSHAFVAGANDYVTKPFNRIELLARIRSALKLKGELDRRKAREDELSKLAVTGKGQGDKSGTSVLIDSASGLPDYRSVDALLLASDDRQIRAVVAFRIDRQSQFCAVQGKGREDDLVRRVGQALSGLPAQLGDLLARYDDDLFVAILFDATADSVRTFVDEARRRVASLRIAHPESPVSSHVTLSVGAALLNIEDRDARLLFAEAMAAVELASKRGNDFAFADEA